MSVRQYQLKIGDKVKVINKNVCSYNCEGIVIQEAYYNGMVKVEFNSWCGQGRKVLSFHPNSLLILSDESEDIKMAKELKGDYRIALVRFVKGRDTLKLYCFALYDSDICINDNVLVDANGTFSVAKVENILSQEEYADIMPTKEVVCKLDFSAYNQRREIRLKRDRIKGQMDKMVKKNQELVLYEMLAEKNPEMAAMLQEYKECNNV